MWIQGCGPGGEWRTGGLRLVCGELRGRFCRSAWWLVSELGMGWERLAYSNPGDVLEGGHRQLGNYVMRLLMGGFMKQTQDSRDVVYTLS
jgi:hypothetical protein